VASIEQPVNAREATRSTVASATNRVGRVRGLDGLRGIAALTVVVGHVLLLWEGSRSTDAVALAESAMTTQGTELYALWNGRGAVLIFFVLSGYVLTLPFTSRSRGFGAGYFLQRWLRIGVPYLVMTTVVMTASVWLSQLPSQSRWPAIMFDRAPTISDVINWGTLIGTPNVAAFNSVVWTLVVEIRLSMLLPLVILAYRRFGVLPVLAVIFAAALVNDIYTIGQPYEGSMMASLSPLSTLHFLPLFAVGSALAMGRVRISSIRWLAEPAVRLTLLLLALTVYVHGHAWAEASTPVTPQLTARTMLTEDYIVGAAGALLVALVAVGVGSGLLTSRPVLALGKASYSLYLWHLPVLVGCCLLLTPAVGIVWAAVVGVAVAAVVTALSYRFIETPVQRIVRARRIATGSRPRHDVAVG
jgi:peptidoglycan/LPS O-acetylase OafA/YrhL